jgi:hypothetical protein
MDLVGGVCVPDDQLAVLRGGDQVSAVSRPMHGVDLGKMAFERPLGFHRQSRELLCSLSRDIAHFEEICKLSGTFDGTHSLRRPATNTAAETGELTCGVSELILLAFYAVFQRLCISPRDLYLLLYRLRTVIRHVVCSMPTAQGQPESE